MKKVLLLVILNVGLISCTQQERAKNYGGKTTVNLPAGEKLVDVTWKESNLWYLTRPMTEKDTIEIYTFREQSSYNMFEGTVTFIESK